MPYVSSYGKAAAQDYLETNSTGEELSYEEQMSAQIAEIDSKRNVTLYSIASELHDMNNFTSSGVNGRLHCRNTIETLCHDSSAAILLKLKTNY